MNYLQIDRASICDGLGFRVVLWVSGCSIWCPECHNPETWDFAAGQPFNTEAKEKLFELLQKPWIKGLTITGGHPFETRNMLFVLKLLEEVKTAFPNKDIWLYTGLTLTYNHFVMDTRISFIPSILRYCDVVVDGPYIAGERDLTLAFRGSRNQRLIDVKKTYEAEEIITLDLED